MNSHRQRGVVLFVALVVLVALMVAGIALMRSVDINTLIAGNLAFRQSATSAADRGIEAARTWLSTNAVGATLNSDIAASAYYANWQNWDYTASDPVIADFNWTTATDLSNDGTGNSVQYVIHRLCDLAGQPTTVNCVKTSAGGTAASTHGPTGYGSAPLSATSQVYYRVTVRVSGPRNTISYVQSLVN